MKLETFDFQSAPLRLMLRNGEPWFVAADVCRVLDLDQVTAAIRGLDEDEKITLANDKGNPRAGIPHQLNLISESGLYALVFKSRKPEAKSFRKWVTGEVLPALRKTGRYETAAAAVTMLPPRTVRDEMRDLRGMLLRSATAVQQKTLDVGRAQQVANLAARFLEAIKMEGDALGYENVFEMQAVEASGGLLHPGEREPAELLQGVPQRALQGEEDSRPSLQAAPVPRQEALGGGESRHCQDSPATMQGAADLGPETNGSAADLPGTGVGALGAD